MNKTPIKKLVFVNLAYWVVAALVHPVSRMLPASSGEPAAFTTGVLIPLVFIGLAAGSTWMWASALGGTKQD